MMEEDFKKLSILITKEERIKSAHFHNYSFPMSWGIATAGTDKPLLMSIAKIDQPYERFSFRSYTDVTSQTEMLLNWLLTQKVLILEPSQVREYLIRHFDLTRILRLTCKLALDRMGMTSQLALEVFRDPEIDDAYLTLSIRQHHYSQDVINQIEDLRAEYEVDLANSAGWFLVSTDFQPPLSPENAL
jgi:hypothetical protein